VATEVRVAFLVELLAALSAATLASRAVKSAHLPPIRHTPIRRYRASTLRDRSSGGEFLTKPARENKEAKANEMDRHDDRCEVPKSASAPKLPLFVPARKEIVQRQ